MLATVRATLPFLGLHLTFFGVAWRSLHLKSVVEAVAGPGAVAVVGLVSSRALLVIGLRTHQLWLGNPLLSRQLLHGKAAHHAILI